MKGLSKRWWAVWNHQRDGKGAQNSKDSVEAAVLHSMTADVMIIITTAGISTAAPTEQLSSEDIGSGRKHLKRYDPKKELETSLKGNALLQQTHLRQNGREIMVTGQDDEALRPSLYEFLAYRALNMQPRERFIPNSSVISRSVNHSKALFAISQLEHLNFNISIRTIKFLMDAFLRLHSTA